MKTRSRIIGIVCLALVCTLAGASFAIYLQPAATAESTPVVVTSPFTAAVNEVRDSVVGVSNYQNVRYSNRYNDWGWGWGWGYGDNGRNNDYTEQEVKYATGSGVVIAEDGYVLTNYHVVEGATSLKVTVGEKEYDATLVVSDQNLDVAILRAPELDIDPVILGDSDTLQVGDWAICIGNPLSQEFASTVTAGIISGLDRAISSSSTDKYGRREKITNTMIQTDAAINNGNSGGGMFNTAGELMGIPTLKYSGSAYSGASVDGIGLCIPINAAKPLISEALATKQSADSDSSQSRSDAAAGSTMIGKPRMGITIANMRTNSYALMTGQLPNGVYVSEVDAGSPAENAGMQAGDIIVDVDGTVITSVSQLQGIIGGKNEGDVLQVKVYRVPGIDDLGGNEEIPEGEYVDLTVTLTVVDVVKQ